MSNFEPIPQSDKDFIINLFNRISAAFPEGSLAFCDISPEDFREGDENHLPLFQLSPLYRVEYICRMFPEYTFHWVSAPDFVARWGCVSLGAAELGISPMGAQIWEVLYTNDGCIAIRRSDSPAKYIEGLLSSLFDAQNFKP